MFLNSYAGNLTSWPLEKYAKFVGTTQGSSTNQNQSQQGHWKQFSSRDGSLQVSLLDSNHLVVSSGSTVHESFSLFDAEKWMKMAVKGDSVLVFYKVNHDTRRFRIMFNKHGPLSALESCRQFLSKMPRVIPVKEISSVCTEPDSQTQMEDSQQTGSDSRSELRAPIAPANLVETRKEQGDKGLTMSQLAKKVTSEPCGLSGKVYKHTNLPTERLNLMIRLCLTDSNFPSFVEAVQKELLEITSENAQAQ